MVRGSKSLIYLVFFSILAFCLCVNSAAEGQGNFQDYSNLFFKAQSQGSVRVIVKLKIPFVPERELTTPAAVLDQQARISESQNQLLKSLLGHKVKGVKRFKHIPYIAMEVNSLALSSLISNPLVESIQEDIAVPPLLNESIPLINADDVWSSGYTGSGWTVAILDTGVDKTHSFFSSKVVSEACFSTTSASFSSTTLCPNGQEIQVGSGAGVDCSTLINGCGHGTHVAGIAAGKSATINGVAKDANIIAIQVFSRFDNPNFCNNNSPCLASWTSDQILALEHVYSLRKAYNIASVNMSLGGGAYSTHCDSDLNATKAAIDHLRSAGIATVIASGNNGYCNSISAPACISTAVSVGATTKTDLEAIYNNYAPILSLFAPGSSINSSIPGGRWASKSGTSMAAPHVAGAWAVIKQAVPSASVSDILNALKTTGVSILNACIGSGYYPQRRIDLSTALNSFYSLTITKAGNGSGTVTSNPEGINCGADCTERYTTGTAVTLTATPSAGSTFAGWSGDADCSDGQVTMNANKSCTAIFNLIQHTLIVTKTGNGSGEVTASDCTLNWTRNTGTCIVNHGTSITLSGVADAGSTFAGWSNGTGSASACTGKDNCSFNITQNSSVAATFVLNQQHTLTVNKTGSGSGTVTSNPEGINCGADCNKDYDYGVVTLTATPSAGSTFAGWSGDCAGTSKTCTVTIDADKTVEATFTPTGKPVISISPMSVNFSPVKVGETFTKTIEIKNTGISDLVIYSITVAGTNEFNIINDNCMTAPIRPGGSCSINVIFKPTIPFGKKIAIMSISSNDPKKPLLSIKLSGTAPPPKISIAPKAVNFSSVRVGDKLTRTVSIKNTGTSDLVIDIIEIKDPITGEYSTEFQTDDSESCKTALIPQGNSCTMTIKFEPTTIGRKSAALRILSNNPKKPTINVKLSGNAPCVNIEGYWGFLREGILTCTIGGFTVSGPFSDSGTVSIVQDGCNIIIDDVMRGNVRGNIVSASGTFRETIDDFSINFKYKGKGTIEENIIDWTGSGRATGTYSGYKYSCTATDNTIFIHSDSVLIQRAMEEKSQSAKFMENILKIFKSQIQQ